MLAIVELARRLGGLITVIRLLSPPGLDGYPPSTIHYPLRLNPPISKPSQMKPAIHINDLTRTERQQILRQRGDCFPYILRLTPALDRSQSLRNEFVVFFQIGRASCR